MPIVLDGTVTVKWLQSKGPILSIGKHAQLMKLFVRNSIPLEQLK